jgi:hypothetical protein
VKKLKGYEEKEKVLNAKIYLMENVLPQFNSKSFRCYIANNLAGDFAIELADLFKKHFEVQCETKNPQHNI